LNGYFFGLLDGFISWSATEACTQFKIFAYIALEKAIFYQQIQSAPINSTEAIPVTPIHCHILQKKEKRFS
jgi:hypothetical protein